MSQATLSTPPSPKPADLVRQSLFDALDKNGYKRKGIRSKDKQRFAVYLATHKDEFENKTSSEIQELLEQAFGISCSHKIVYELCDSAGITYKKRSYKFKTPTHRVNGDDLAVLFEEVRELTTHVREAIGTMIYHSAHNTALKTKLQKSLEGVQKLEQKLITKVVTLKG